MCRQFGRRFETKSQQQIEENEDCLHLNIYVPVVRTWGEHLIINHCLD